MNKLRVFESFCGYGSQSIALENIGVLHEVVAISDIDADVLISYGAIRGDLSKSISLTDDEIKKWLMDRNIGWDFQKQKSSIPRMKKDKLYKLYNACIEHNCLGDISIIDPNSIPDHDLFTYSFPCFVEGTLVMTENGFKKIEDITCEDKVLTHTNQFKKVIKPMINKTDHIYKIRNMCSEDLYVTEEHPFYVRKRSRVWNNENRTYERKFSDPQWVSTKDLTKDTYLGVAINQKSELPKWDGYSKKWSTGIGEQRSYSTNLLNNVFNKEDFWWVIGRLICRLDKLGKVGEYIFSCLLEDYFGFDCIIPKVHLTTDYNMSIYGIDTLFYNEKENLLMFGESKISVRINNGITLIKKSLKDYEKQISDEFELVLSNRLYRDKLYKFKEVFGEQAEMSLDIHQFIKVANITKIGIPLFIAHGCESDTVEILNQLEKIVPKKMLNIETVYYAISLPIINKEKLIAVFTSKLREKGEEYKDGANK